MQKYSKAHKENVICKFTIKAYGWTILETGQKLEGEIRKSNGGIVFKIPNGIESIIERAALFSLNLSNERFNIYFTSNLNSFKIQHNAIKFMKLHQLHRLLIGNDRYQMYEHPSFERLDYGEFR